MPSNAVPAKMFVPLMANDWEEELYEKPLCLVQLPPLLVEKYTRPPVVPAKMFVPLMANEVTPREGSRPLFTAVQLLPLLVDKNTPSAMPAGSQVPAKMFVPLMAIDTTSVAGNPLFTA